MKEHSGLTRVGLIVQRARRRKRSGIKARVQARIWSILNTTIICIRGRGDGKMFLTESVVSCRAAFSGFLY
jgi:hypothetical protein